MSDGLGNYRNNEAVGLSIYIIYTNRVRLIVGGLLLVASSPGCVMHDK